ncbi:MAG: hypothetical protein UV42_C0022G0011 [Candidatus Magasanikbacteria bacterium GW2011_GWE2_42_7]|uniref:Uncharacterized protein n=1 Tax=Candidatus Magasanikbacteria bacterium GW2011_GWE2_42_7 TaxID=1619052 RepID=A0A0G1DLI3_9BACT|nr:MAG: hypothetical protein UV42_C0022G0011 [Candidatus Magasanikbacteria bacterium GW2011_GWE2_42_7]
MPDGVESLREASLGLIQKLVSLSICAMNGNPEARKIARNSLELPETVRDDGDRRMLGEQIDVLVELLHGQQTRLAADQVHMGNLTLCD